VAVDGQGNVFVSGSANNGTNSTDFLTIKYSANGTPLWTNRYDGPAHGADDVVAIALDAGGNAYVGGSSALIKYSSSGAVLWVNRFNGTGTNESKLTGLALDANGNAVVTGFAWDPTSRYDMVTLKYSSAGVPLWTNQFCGPTDGYGIAVGVGPDGSIFAGGRTLNDSGCFQCVTIKYSSGGIPSWTNFYQPPAQWNYYLEALAVDAQGNVFVTSMADGYATVKYSSVGIPLWTNRYKASQYFDEPSAILVDPAGNVVVTGSSYLAYLGPGEWSRAYATVKYSSTGQPLWTNQFAGPQNYDSQATALAVDSDSTVFVTGRSDWYFGTLAYSGAGVPLWTNIDLRLITSWDAAITSEATANAVAVDTNHNVFVAGFAQQLSLDTDIDFDVLAVVKYSPPPPLLQGLWAGNALVLRWTNAAFGLQSALSPPGPFTNIPGATSPWTNTLSAPQLFFRLLAN
jgi:hypothetical protein